MSQHDMIIDNQPGAAFRADLNQALAAIATNQSGSVEPNPSYPYQFWADTASGTLKMRNAANTAWTKLGQLGATNFGLVLPGTIAYHARNAVPAGYLRCNGAAVSRTVYADLFAEVGTTFGNGDGSQTFNVPDLRGEFLRGWDDARGVDAGRTFGSAQADLFKQHTHSGLPGQGVVQGQNGAGNYMIVSDNSYAPIGSTGGTETRPRNIALLACIKY